MTTLVYGGAASGKSEYAEGLAEAAFAAAGPESALRYIATMTASDEESRERITKHRDRRVGKDYRTVECAGADALLAFAETVDGRDVLLLDDVGNLVANELFPPAEAWTGDPEPLSEDELRDTVGRLATPFATLQARSRDLVIVTNDIFGDRLPGETVPAGVDNYQKVLAGLNIALAARADRVVEVVAGLPLDRKGGEQQ